MAIGIGGLPWPDDRIKGAVGVGGGGGGLCPSEGGCCGGDPGPGQQEAGCSEMCPPGDSVSGMSCQGGGMCETRTCMIGSTQVLMADGTTKAIEDVDVNDEVAGFGPSGVPRDQIVNRLVISRAAVVTVNFNGGSFTCTTYHPVFLTDWTVKRVENLEVGDQLADKDGNGLEVTSIEPAGTARVYSFECAPDHVFIAEGVRQHNKGSGGGPGEG